RRQNPQRYFEESGPSGVTICANDRETGLPQISTHTLHHRGLPDRRSSQPTASSLSSMASPSRNRVYFKPGAVTIAFRLNPPGGGFCSSNISLLCRFSRRL